MNVDIDLQRDGKQSGYIRISHSTDESAYGWILIPVTSIRNGDGPKILCTGGIHGDEYEGQIAWTHLAQKLEARDITGHLIIIPAVNVHSAVANSRVSPLDGVNLNRCFPGNRAGTPSERLAHLIESELLPLVDLVIDIHSGGNSLLYLPGPTITLDADPQRHAKMLEIAKAYGGPFVYIFDESGGGDAALIGACRRAGINRLGSEMGGGGGVSIEGVRLTEEGILRALRHLGVIADAAIEPARSQRSRIIRRGGPMSDHYTYAEDAGVFNPLNELGDEVSSGQVVGEILFPETPWRAPIPVVSRMDGIVICRRAKGRTARGDGLMVFGKEVASDG